jgi:hypothetical protein
VSSSPPEQFQRLVEAFADDIGAAPAFGEVLEILSLAGGSAGFDAKLGRRKYRPSGPSRVAELNDNAFVEASGLLAMLPDDQAPDLLPLVRSTAFADVDGARITSIVARISKQKAPKPVVGDIVAIPLGDGRYRLGVVVARNRFGTALGLLRGAVAAPRPVRDGEPLRPVYTDDEQVLTGAWPVVGRDEDLLKLFPADPEHFQSPMPHIAILNTGPFGSAETASGVLRHLDEAEAREVGVLDPDYRSILLSEDLTELIRQGRFD